MKKHPDQTTGPAPEANTKPIHEIRLNHVKLAIWRNEGETGTWYSVSACRVYRTKEGAWQQAPSFHAADLLALSKAADMADSWIRQSAHRATARQSAPEESP